MWPNFPPMQTPLEADPMHADHLNAVHMTSDACWKANTLVNRQTDIKTLPSATSFSGSNEINFRKPEYVKRRCGKCYAMLQR